MTKETEVTKMKPVMVLKKFFEMDIHQAKKEIISLSKEERLELAELAAIELGVELDLS